MIVVVHCSFVLLKINSGASWSVFLERATFSPWVRSRLRPISEGILRAPLMMVSELPAEHELTSSWHSKRNVKISAEEKIKVIHFMLRHPTWFYKHVWPMSTKFTTGKPLAAAACTLFFHLRILLTVSCFSGLSFQHQSLRFSFPQTPTICEAGGRSH